ASWRGRRDWLRLHLSLGWRWAVVGFYQVDRDPRLCIADVKDDALGRLKLDVIRLKTVLVELHFEGLWRRIWRTADHRVGNPQLRLSVVDFVGYRIATRPEHRRCKNIAVAKLPAVKHRWLVGRSWSVQLCCEAGGASRGVEHGVAGSGHDQLAQFRTQLARCVHNGTQVDLQRGGEVGCGSITLKGSSIWNSGMSRSKSCPSAVVTRSNRLRSTPNRFDNQVMMSPGMPRMVRMMPIAPPRIDLIRSLAQPGRPPSKLSTA